MSAAAIILAGIICNPQLGCLDNLIPQHPLVIQRRAYDETNDIGRAMNICEQHSHEPNSVYPEGGTPREYDKGWEACYRVRQEWQKGEEAARIQRQREQDGLDKGFVEGLSKKLDQ